LLLKSLARVFAVFFQTHEIHKLFINLLISNFLAFSIPESRFSKDFFLNHSRDNISSFFSSILKISTKLLIIHFFKNNSICFCHKPSISNQDFPTAKISFSVC
jgi:hypothetical protein